MLKNFLALIFLFTYYGTKAETSAFVLFDLNEDQIIIITSTDFENIEDPIIKNFLKSLPLPVFQKLKVAENKRMTAFFLAVFLGHFGVHRLYLGTEPIVPVAYVLTFGGGIILPFIDAALILTTKNLEQYENNSRFFMFIGD
jgi:TM2 domain-containing membrane protein YozV